MLQLRVFVPPDRASEVLASLGEVGSEGLHTLTHFAGVEVVNGDDLITALIEPTVANDVVDRLRELAIDRPGGVTLIRQDHIEVSRTEGNDLGFWDTAADAVIVEEIVDESRENARLSLTYLLYMVTAGIIAGIGIGLDESVLIVGAMAISPDLLPLTAICVGVVARERRTVVMGFSTLLAGLGVASASAGILVWITGLVRFLRPDLPSNVFTAFVTDPSAAGAIVALSAGVAAMLSIERRASSAVGVAISVTTIPAAAAIGVTLGLGETTLMAGAASVLAINVACLALAGSLTLLIQVKVRGRLTARMGRGLRRSQSSTRPPARQ